MSQTTIPNDPVISGRARLLRWGFALFVGGFLLLLTDIFNLRGPVWDAIILLIAFIITPQSVDKTNWGKWALFFIGGILVLIALIFFAVWVGEKIGISTGIILAALVLFAGIVCQILGGILWPARARPASGLSSSLIEKIRGL